MKKISMFLVLSMLLFGAFTVYADSVITGTDNTIVITMDKSDLESMNNAKEDDTTLYSATITINGIALESVGVRLSVRDDMAKDENGQGGPAPENGQDGMSPDGGKGSPDGNKGQGGPAPEDGKGETDKRPVSYFVQLDSSISGQNYNGLTSFILNPKMEAPEGMEKPENAPDNNAPEGEDKNDPEPMEMAEVTLTLNDEDMGSYTIFEK